jgi:hypothetical protein
MNGIFGRGELRRVLLHRVAAVGRDDGETDVASGRHLVRVRRLHRARDGTR